MCGQNRTHKIKNEVISFKNYFVRSVGFVCRNVYKRRTNRRKISLFIFPVMVYCCRVAVKSLGVFLQPAYARFGGDRYNGAIRNFDLYNAANRMYKI